MEKLYKSEFDSLNKQMSYVKSGDREIETENKLEDIDEQIK